MAIRRVSSVAMVILAAWGLLALGVGCSGGEDETSSDPNGEVERDTGERYEPRPDTADDEDTGEAPDTSGADTGGGDTAAPDVADTDAPPPDTGAADVAGGEPEIVDCAAQTPDVVVEIRDRQYVGGDVTVAPGGVVEFANEDDDEHDVASGNGSGDPNSGELFASQTLSNGDSVCIAFPSPGEYPYFCTFHPDMTGTVTVREGDQPPPEEPTEVNCSAVTAAATVSIEDRTYVDSSPTISDGEVVEWVNNDDEEHTVVSGENDEDSDRGQLFDSGEIPEGASFCVQFPTGSYPYFCRERGADEMAGTIAVQ